MPHECTDCGRSFADGSKEMLSGCPDCGGNKFRYRPEGGRMEAPDDGHEDTGDDRRREGSTGPDDAPDSAGPGGSPQGRSSDSDSNSGRSSTADAVGDAAATLRSLVGGAGSDPDPPDSSADAEDAAQASARRGVVDPDEIAAADDRRSDVSGAGADSKSESGAESAATGSDGPTVERVRPEATDGDATADATDDAGRTELTGADDPAGDTNLSELRAELNDQFESIRIVEPGQYELNLMELYDREEYIVSLMEDGRYAIEVPETWREDR